MAKQKNLRMSWQKVKQQKTSYTKTLKRKAYVSMTRKGLVT